MTIGIVIVPSHYDSGCHNLNSFPYGPGNHELHNKDVLTMFLLQLPWGQSQIILHAQHQPWAFSGSGTSTQHLHEPTLSLEIISAPSICISTSWAAQKSDATRENFGLNTGKWRHNQDHLLLRLLCLKRNPVQKVDHNGSLFCVVLLDRTVVMMQSLPVNVPVRQWLIWHPHFCRKKKNRYWFYDYAYQCCVIYITI